MTLTMIMVLMLVVIGGEHNDNHDSGDNEDGSGDASDDDDDSSTHYDDDHFDSDSGSGIGSTSSDDSLSCSICCSSISRKNPIFHPYMAIIIIIIIDRCDETKKALKALDMDEDGVVDWNEFALYLKWALRQYPLIKDAEEMLSIAFRKGLIPAMQDQVLNQC